VTELDGAIDAFQATVAGVDGDSLQELAAAIPGLAGQPTRSTS
jgi:hypothetical protein